MTAGNWIIISVWGGPTIVGAFIFLICDSRERLRVRHNRNLAQGGVVAMGNHLSPDERPVTFKQLDILLEMYQENNTHGRHHESQRSSVATILAAIAGAIVAFISNAINQAKPPTQETLRYLACMAAMIMGIGVFGALFAAKQTERARFHQRLAGAYRRKIDELSGLGITSIRHAVKGVHNAERPFLLWLKAGWLFVTMNLFIAIIGVAFLIYLIFLFKIPTATPP